MNAIKTVAQLRKILAELPDNAPVLLSYGDHSYRQPSAFSGTALLDKKHGWSEDCGEQFTPESDYGKRVQALIIK